MFSQPTISGVTGKLEPVRSLQEGYRSSAESVVVLLLGVEMVVSPNHRSVLGHVVLNSSLCTQPGEPMVNKDSKTGHFVIVSVLESTLLITHNATDFRDDNSLHEVRRHMKGCRTWVIQAPNREDCAGSVLP